MGASLDIRCVAAADAMFMKAGRVLVDPHVLAGPTT
jgi:hypothetical protein